jgi:hypothetical protein
VGIVDRLCATVELTHARPRCTNPAAEEHRDEIRAACGPRCSSLPMPLLAGEAAIGAAHTFKIGCAHRPYGGARGAEVINV